MRRAIAAAGAALLAAGLLAGCGGQPQTTITLWAGPVGDFATSTEEEDPAAGVIAAFRKENPGIGLEVSYLSAADIDAKLAAGERPDLLLDSSERLIRAADSGVAFADLGGLWTEDLQADVNGVSEAIAPACQDGSGSWRVLPLAVMVDCMAVNPTLFEAAGAGDLLTDSRTWTPDQFTWALDRLVDSGIYQTGLLYSGAAYGDQGTRMLAQNLAGIPFTDAGHTRYTFEGEKALAALTTLRSLCDTKRLSYEKAATAADAIRVFAGGSSALSLCWSATIQNTFAAESPFTPYPMAYPAQGDPVLYGTVWGFALPDTGDSAKMAAAQALAQSLCASPDAVRLTGQLPARSSLGDVWAETPYAQQMAGFAALLPYLGDLYGVTPGWNDQREAWRVLMQDTVTAETVDAALATYTAAVG